MCPVCITTVALAVAGASSAGGLGALIVKSIRAKTDAKIVDPKPQPELIERHASP